MENESNYQFLLILDFEANCNSDGLPKPKPQEIIEFPTILYNVKTQRIDSEFHYYIKPQIKLTEFCTKLTGITQDMVDNGKPFVEVLDLHRKWLVDCQLLDDKDQKIVPFTYVTCGDWDLNTIININARHFKIHVPSYLKSWINIKTVFAKYTKKKSKRNGWNA